MQQSTVSIKQTDSPECRLLQDSFDVFHSVLLVRFGFNLILLRFLQFYPNLPSFRSQSYRSNFTPNKWSQNLHQMVSLSQKRLSVIPKNKNSHPKTHAKANKLHAGCNSFSRRALCNRKSRFSHDIRFPARHFSFKQNFSSWARKKAKENEKKRVSCGLN